VPKILFEIFYSFVFFFYFFWLGIEPSGNHVDAPAKFHVETFAAGKGNVDVVVINPKGQREKVKDKKKKFFILFYFKYLFISVMWNFVMIKIKHMIAHIIQQWKDNIK